MAHERFLRDLQCPYCGGDLHLESRQQGDGPQIEFGTLRCRCYRYAIVLGIVILRQASPPNDHTDPIVAALDRDNRDAALEILLDKGSAAPSGRGAAISRLASLLRRRRPSGADNAFPRSETLRDALRRWRPDYYGEYLEYRYANPSLLTAIPVIAALTKALAQDGNSTPTVIDLGCGVGQTTYLLKSLLPSSRIVAADLDFLNLALAKHYVVPDGNFVCFDAEAGLPFKDAIFDAAFSLDCVHYIRGKHRLAAELARVGRPEALHALCHLHNLGRANPNQGIPLSSDGYANVFGQLAGRLYAEPALLEAFSRTGSLDLDAAASKASTDAADAFVHLSIGDGDTTSASTQLDRYMATRLACFSLNGLYDRVGLDSAAELRLRWPSEMLRAECCTGFEPLQDKVKLPRAFMDAVLARRLHDLPREIAEALIRSFVVVPQPDGLRAQR